MWRMAVIAVLAGCSGSSPPTGPAPPVPAAGAEYRATIRWTEHGVPHVLAGDLGAVAFGQGYAFAVVDGCLLAERVLTVRSQRSRFLGPGESDTNVDSDFAYLTLGAMERARTALPGLSAETRAVIAGFTAGYNHRLAGAGLDGFCRGAPWVGPITDVDLLAHAQDVAMMASSRAFIGLGRIGAAHPRRAGAGPSGALPPPPHRALASNGWAIGAERSATGRGMLVANPHFPWLGPLTFYEAHLTVPGLLDAYGANLAGMPLLGIAFTRDVAWTHTFSDAVRFTVYRVNLDPKDPTRYQYGDETRAMTARRFTVQVRRPDGTVAPVERTLWHSHYGPMLDGDQLGWDVAAGVAYTLRDAAIESTRGLDQYLDMLRARTVAELRAALVRHQTTPFVNVMATDRNGDVFFADGSRVPNLSPAALATWRLGRRTIPALQQAWENGLVVLDGSRPLFEWVDDPAAPAPGVIPFTAAPQLARRDYVFNANDPAWIANPAAPLTAHSPLYGDVEAPLSPRSRMNLKMLTETGPTGASGADGRFDLDELERAILSNRVFTAELLLEDVLARCRGDACDALAGWNRRDDLDGRGALLWRELVGTFERKDYYGGSMFAVPFDPKRPLETPAGIAAKAEEVAERLRRATAALAAAQIDRSGSPGERQFTEIAGQRIPVHGSPELVGNTNQTMFQPQNTLAPGMDAGTSINWRSGLTSRGYPINYGSSFVLVLAFGENGPQARGLMTYGSAEQMAMWSRKQLRPMRFSEADIRADPALRTEEIRAPRTGDVTLRP